MFLVSAVASILFLGGWHTGIGPIDDALMRMRATGAATDGFVLSSYVANLVGFLILVVKGSLGVFVQIWIRWTLPRLRIDQVMLTCLKYLVPISCFLFLGATLWPVVLTRTLGRTTLFNQPSPPLGEKLERRSVSASTDVEQTTTSAPHQSAEPGRLAATGADGGQR
jgi:NADH-quinone oxidoreductase subunit H